MTTFAVFNPHSKHVSANLWLQRNGLRLNTFEVKSMLNHSSRKVTANTLELSVNGSQVEQVCSCTFLRVTINDSHGPTTSTRSEPKSPTTSIFFTVSLGFFFSLFFFSSLSLTFLPLTTVTMSGLGAPSLRLPGWRPFSTMPTVLSFVNVEGPPHRMLVGN